EIHVVSVDDARVGARFVADEVARGIAAQILNGSADELHGVGRIIGAAIEDTGYVAEQRAEFDFALAEFLAGLLQLVDHGANGVAESSDLVARRYLLDGGKIALADPRHGRAQPHDRLCNAI